MKTYYYYFRNAQKAPLVTVCLMTGESEFVRGIAVCSPLDIVSKAIGRGLARGKALRALGTRSNSSPIKRTIVSEIREEVGFPKTWKYKSEYMPELSSFERKLVEK